MGEQLGEAILTLRTDDSGLYQGIDKARGAAEGLGETFDQVQQGGIQAGGAVQQFSSALKSSRLEMNQSRIGMMEFQHIARGVSDQFAASGLSTQLFTSHIGELSEAVVLSGGAFGKLGLFLQGPWGIALTLALSAAVPLLVHLLGQKKALDDVYEKLVKHKEQTELSAQAEETWSHTIDGLIERSDKLNEKLEKRLQTQTALQRVTMTQTQEDFAAATAAEAKLAADPHATQKQIDDAEKAIHRTAIALHNAQVAAAQDAGEAIASITEAAKTWADQQKQAIEVLQTAHPELAEKAVADQMLAAYNELKDAIDKAAGANIDFNATVIGTNRLNQALASGAISAAAYDEKIRGLAQSLNAAVAAAKNAPKAIEEFKKAVFGAEGTGPNKLGSSAAGFGQFMPSTWESYFKQIYPQQAAALSSEQILALRNNREVATAVIEQATKDYVTVVKAAGQQITAASLYTVHLLGARDAAKLFNAPAGESTGAFLSAAVLNGNPFLRGTAGDARAAIAKRIGGSSGAVSSGAGAIEQQLAQQASNERSYQDEVAQLDEQILEARRKLAGGEQEAVQDQIDDINRQRDKTIADALAAEAAGKIGAGEEQHLELQARELASLKVALVDREALAKQLDEQRAANDQFYEFQIAGLKFADEMATTQAEHRKAQLDMLDIAYQQKLYDLQILKSKQELAGDFANAILTQGQINELGTQKDRERSQILQNTSDPLQQWARSVPQTAQQITEAIHGIEVQGIDGLISSIDVTKLSFKSLEQLILQSGANIASMILQLIAKMLILRELTSAFGGLFGGSIPSPDISSPMSTNLPIAAPLPHLAGGGFMAIGGNGGVDRNLLSINGQRRAMVGADETLAVIPRGGVLAAANNNPQPAKIELTVTGDDLWQVQVGQVSNAIVDLKTPGIVKQARMASAKDMTKKRIGG